MRIIDQLRKHYPGPWKYDREHYGHRWIGPNFNVHSANQLTPQHDSDDETSITIHLREDTQTTIGVNNLIYTP